MPFKGLISLGVWFWALLPVLGILLWVGSGWFTHHQLNQSAPSTDSIQIKSPKSN